MRGRGLITRFCRLEWALEIERTLNLIMEAEPQAGRSLNDGDGGVRVWLVRGRQRRPHLTITSELSSHRYKPLYTWRGLIRLYFGTEEHVI